MDTGSGHAVPAAQSKRVDQKIKELTREHWFVATAVLPSSPAMQHLFATTKRFRFRLMECNFNYMIFCRFHHIATRKNRL